MYLSRGNPVIYYGDEQGFVGDGGDQDARQDMFPSQVATYNDDDLIATDATTAQENFDAAHPLYEAISRLAAIRAWWRRFASRNNSRGRDGGRKAPRSDEGRRVVSQGSGLLRRAAMHALRPLPAGVPDLRRDQARTP